MLPGVENFLPGHVLSIGALCRPTTAPSGEWPLNLLVAVLSGQQRASLCYNEWGQVPRPEPKGMVLWAGEVQAHPLPQL